MNGGDSPLRVALPLADEVTGTNAEERALGFGGDGLGQITLACAWWAV
jgi:hypothetical protein